MITAKNEFGVIDAADRNGGASRRFVLLSAYSGSEAWHWRLQLAGVGALGHENYITYCF
jgi:hypothetical protein